MPAPRPRPKTPSAPADPNYWGRVGQAMWETNLAAPLRAVHGLLNADPHTLYTDEGEAGQQAAADSFDVAGSVTAGSAFTPKPSNALMAGYGKVPDSLLGFRKNAPNKGFSSGNYPYVGEVVVDFGDGEPFRDAIRGLNKTQILERAKRNWPDARNIELVGDVYRYKPQEDY